MDLFGVTQFELNIALGAPLYASVLFVLVMGLILDRFVYSHTLIAVAFVAMLGATLEVRPLPAFETWVVRSHLTT